MIANNEIIRAMNAQQDRIDAIDFVKGALVLLMVVYHALNYLNYDSLPHDLMAFLPASFITVAGYLVTRVYSNRQGTSMEIVRARLVTRAVKLLVIFTVLNVGARLILSRSHKGNTFDVATFFNQWFNVFVTGDAPHVAFNVLVPIGYTLLLSVPIMAIQRSTAAFPAVAAGLSFFACVALDLSGNSVNGLYFISAGVIGMWLGTYTLQKVDSVATSWVTLAMLVAGYFLLLVLRQDNFISQVYFTLVSLTVLYAVGRKWNASAGAYRQACLLGRYSLLSYILQIVFLQGAPAFARLPIDFEAVKVLLLVSVVSTLVWLCIAAVDWGRKELLWIDRAYKAVFA